MPCWHERGQLYLYHLIINKLLCVNERSVGPLTAAQAVTVVATLQTLLTPVF